jgi:uncharacterized protein with HEPN domain
MNEKDKNRLHDMLEAAQKARHFIEGKTRQSLDEDELLALALTRLLEIVGEAARNVTQETCDELSQLPWVEMVGMRHRITHDYLHVDYDIVWDTLIEDLPPLIKELEKILEP